jgi:hypothetical protein
MYLLPRRSTADATSPLTTTMTMATKDIATSSPPPTSITTTTQQLPDDSEEHGLETQMHLESTGLFFINFFLL